MSCLGHGLLQGGHTQIDRYKHGKRYRCKYRYMYRYIDISVGVDGQTDRYIDRQTNRWMGHGSMKTQKVPR